MITEVLDFLLQHTSESDRDWLFVVLQKVANHAVETTKIDTESASHAQMLADLCTFLELHDPK